MYDARSDAFNHEKEWLLLLRGGDEQAFERLYALYSVRILRKLILLLKDEETAKEILQDIFLTIWEKRQAIDPEKSFRSYLFRIAENKVVDFFRRAACNKELRQHLIKTATGSYNHTEENFTFKESHSLLQQAVNGLPPQRRKVFILCRIEGKSYEEAGKLLGISPGTVNDHMVKAAKALKHYLNPSALTALMLFILLSR